MAARASRETRPQPLGVRVRHAPCGFRYLGLRRSGLHPSLRLQGQFQLDIPPLGPHERTVLLTLSAFGPSSAKPTTMPSADFCAAITGLAVPLSPGLPDTTQTSRGKTDRLHRTPAGFTTPALDGYGLRDHWLARPAGQASYPVLVHRVAALLHASFRPRLATTPLRFAHPSPPSSWIEDLHLQAVDHARHKKKAGPKPRQVGRENQEPACS